MANENPHEIDLTPVFEAKSPEAANALARVLFAQSPALRDALKLERHHNKKPLRSLQGDVGSSPWTGTLDTLTFFKTMEKLQAGEWTPWSFQLGSANPKRMEADVRKITLIPESPAGSPKEIRFRVQRISLDLAGIFANAFKLILFNPARLEIGPQRILLDGGPWRFVIEGVQANPDIRSQTLWSPRAGDSPDKEKLNKWLGTMTLLNANTLTWGLITYERVLNQELSDEFMQDIAEDFIKKADPPPPRERDLGAILRNVKAARPFRLPQGQTVGTSPQPAPVIRQTGGTNKQAGAKSVSSDGGAGSQPALLQAALVKRVNLKETKNHWVDQLADASADWIENTNLRSDSFSAYNINKGQNKDSYEISEDRNADGKVEKVAFHFPGLSPMLREGETNVLYIETSDSSYPAFPLQDVEAIQLRRLRPDRFYQSLILFFSAELYQSYATQLQQEVPGILDGTQERARHIVKIPPGQNWIEIPGRLDRQDNVILVFGDRPSSSLEDGSFNRSPEKITAAFRARAQRDPANAVERFIFPMLLQLLEPNLPDESRARLLKREAVDAFVFTVSVQEEGTDALWRNFIADMNLLAENIQGIPADVKTFLARVSRSLNKQPEPDASAAAQAQSDEPRLGAVDSRQKPAGMTEEKNSEMIESSPASFPNAVPMSSSDVAPSSPDTVSMLSANATPMSFPQVSGGNPQAKKPTAVLTGKLFTTVHGVRDGFFFKSSFIPHSTVRSMAYAKRLDVGFYSGWTVEHQDTGGVYGSVKQSPKSRARVETDFKMEMNDPERIGHLIISHTQGAMRADFDGYEGVSIEGEGPAVVLTFYFKTMTMDPNILAESNDPSSMLRDPEQAALLFAGEFERGGRYIIRAGNENEIRAQLGLPERGEVEGGRWKVEGDQGQKSKAALTDRDYDDLPELVQFMAMRAELKDLANQLGVFLRATPEDRYTGRAPGIPENFRPIVDRMTTLVDRMTAWAGESAFVAYKPAVRRALVNGAILILANDPQAATASNAATAQAQPDEPRLETATASNAATAQAQPDEPRLETAYQLVYGEDADNYFFYNLKTGQSQKLSRPWINTADVENKRLTQVNIAQVFERPGYASNFPEGPQTIQQIDKWLIEMDGTLKPERKLTYDDVQNILRRLNTEQGIAGVRYRKLMDSAVLANRMNSLWDAIVDERRSEVRGKRGGRWKVEGRRKRKNEKLESSGLFAVIAAFVGAGAGDVQSTASSFFSPSTFHLPPSTSPSFRSEVRSPVSIPSNYEPQDPETLIGYWHVRYKDRNAEASRAGKDVRNWTRFFFLKTDTAQDGLEPSPAIHESIYTLSIINDFSNHEKPWSVVEIRRSAKEGFDPDAIDGGDVIAKAEFSGLVFEKLDFAENPMLLLVPSTQALTAVLKTGGILPENFDGTEWQGDLAIVYPLSADPNDDLPTPVLPIKFTFAEASLDVGASRDRPLPVPTETIASAPSVVSLVDADFGIPPDAVRLTDLFAMSKAVRFDAQTVQRLFAGTAYSLANPSGQAKLGSVTLGSEKKDKDGFSLQVIEGDLDQTFKGDMANLYFSLPLGPIPGLSNQILKLELMGWKLGVGAGGDLKADLRLWRSEKLELGNLEFLSDPYDADTATYPREGRSDVSDLHIVAPARSDRREFYWTLKNVSPEEIRDRWLPFVKQVNEAAADFAPELARFVEGKGLLIQYGDSKVVLRFETAAAEKDSSSISDVPVFTTYPEIMTMFVSAGYRMEDGNAPAEAAYVSAGTLEKTVDSGTMHILWNGPQSLAPDAAGIMIGSSFAVEEAGAGLRQTLNLHLIFSDMTPNGKRATLTTVNPFFSLGDSIKASAKLQARGFQGVKAVPLENNRFRFEYEFLKGELEKESTDPSFDSLRPKVLQALFTGTYANGDEYVIHYGNEAELRTELGLAPSSQVLPLPASPEEHGGGEDSFIKTALTRDVRQQLEAYKVDMDSMLDKLHTSLMEQKEWALEGMHDDGAMQADKETSRGIQDLITAVTNLVGVDVYEAVDQSELLEARDIAVITGVNAGNRTLQGMVIEKGGEGLQFFDFYRQTLENLSYSPVSEIVRTRKRFSWNKVFEAAQKVVDGRDRPLRSGTLVPGKTEADLLPWVTQGYDKPDFLSNFDSWAAGLEGMFVHVTALADDGQEGSLYLGEKTDNPAALPAEHKIGSFLLQPGSNSGVWGSMPGALLFLQLPLAEGLEFYFDNTDSASEEVWFHTRESTGEKEHRFKLARDQITGLKLEAPKEEKPTLSITVKDFPATVIEEWLNKIGAQAYWARNLANISANPEAVLLTPYSFIRKINGGFELDAQKLRIVVTLEEVRDRSTSSGPVPDAPRAGMTGNLTPADELVEFILRSGEKIDSLDKFVAYLKRFEEEAKPEKGPRLGPDHIYAALNKVFLWDTGDATAMRNDQLKYILKKIGRWDYDLVKALFKHEPEYVEPYLPEAAFKRALEKIPRDMSGKKMDGVDLNENDVAFLALEYLQMPEEIIRSGISLSGISLPRNALSDRLELARQFACDFMAATAPGHRPSDGAGAVTAIDAGAAPGHRPSDGAGAVTAIDAGAAVPAAQLTDTTDIQITANQAQRGQQLERFKKIVAKALPILKRPIVNSSKDAIDVDLSGGSKGDFPNKDGFTNGDRNLAATFLQSLGYILLDGQKRLLPPSRLISENTTREGFAEDFLQALEETHRQLGNDPGFLTQAKLLPLTTLLSPYNKNFWWKNYLALVVTEVLGLEAPSRLLDRILFWPEIVQELGSDQAKQGLSSIIQIEDAPVGDAARKMMTALPGWTNRKYYFPTGELKEEFEFFLTLPDDLRTTIYANLKKPVLSPIDLDIPAENVLAMEIAGSGELDSERYEYHTFRVWLPAVKFQVYAEELRKITTPLDDYSKSTLSDAFVQTDPTAKRITLKAMEGDRKDRIELLFVDPVEIPGIVKERKSASGSISTPVTQLQSSLSSVDPSSDGNLSTEDSDRLIGFAQVNLAMQLDIDTQTRLRLDGDLAKEKILIFEEYDELVPSDRRINWWERDRFVLPIKELSDIATWGYLPDENKVLILSKDNSAASGEFVSTATQRKIAWEIIPESEAFKRYPQLRGVIKLKSVSDNPGSTSAGADAAAILTQPGTLTSRLLAQVKKMGWKKSNFSNEDDEGWGVPGREAEYSLWHFKDGSVLLEVPGLSLIITAAGDVSFDKSAYYGETGESKEFIAWPVLAELLLDFEVRETNEGKPVFIFYTTQEKLNYFKSQIANRTPPHATAENLIKRTLAPDRSKEILFTTTDGNELWFKVKDPPPSKKSGTSSAATAQAQPVGPRLGPVPAEPETVLTAEKETREPITVKGLVRQLREVPGVEKRNLDYFLDEEKIALQGSPLMKDLTQAVFFLEFAQNSNGQNPMLEIHADKYPSQSPAAIYFQQFLIRKRGSFQPNWQGGEDEDFQDSLTDFDISPENGGILYHLRFSKIPKHVRQTMSALGIRAGKKAQLYKDHGKELANQYLLIEEEKSKPKAKPPAAPIQPQPAEADQAPLPASPGEHGGGEDRLFPPVAGSKPAAALTDGPVVLKTVQELQDYLERRALSKGDIYPIVSTGDKRVWSDQKSSTLHITRKKEGEAFDTATFFLTTDLEKYHMTLGVKIHNGQDIQFGLQQQAWRDPAGNELQNLGGRIIPWYEFHGLEVAGLFEPFGLKIFLDPTSVNARELKQILLSWNGVNPDTTWRVLPGEPVRGKAEIILGEPALEKPGTGPATLDGPVPVRGAISGMANLGSGRVFMDVSRVLDDMAPNSWAINEIKKTFSAIPEPDLKIAPELFGNPATIWVSIADQSLMESEFYIPDRNAGIRKTRLTQEIGGELENYTWGSFAREYGDTERKGLLFRLEQGDDTWNFFVGDPANVKLELSAESRADPGLRRLLAATFQTINDTLITELVMAVTLTKTRFAAEVFIQNNQLIFRSAKTDFIFRSDAPDFIQKITSHPDLPDGISSDPAPEQQVEKTQTVPGTFEAVPGTEKINAALLAWIPLDEKTPFEDFEGVDLFRDPRANEHHPTIWDAMVRFREKPVARSPNKAYATLRVKVTASGPGIILGGDNRQKNSGTGLHYIAVGKLNVGKTTIQSGSVGSREDYLYIDPSIVLAKTINTTTKAIRFQMVPEAYAGLRTDYENIKQIRSELQVELGNAQNPIISIQAGSFKVIYDFRPSAQSQSDTGERTEIASSANERRARNDESDDDPRPGPGPSEKLTDGHKPLPNTLYAFVQEASGQFWIKGTDGTSMAIDLPPNVKVFRKTQPQVFMGSDGRPHAVFVGQATERTNDSYAVYVDGRKTGVSGFDFDWYGELKTAHDDKGIGHWYLPIQNKNDRSWTVYKDGQPLRVFEQVFQNIEVYSVEGAAANLENVFFRIDNLQKNSVEFYRGGEQEKKLFSGRRIEGAHTAVLPGGDVVLIAAVSPAEGFGEDPWKIYINDQPLTPFTGYPPKLKSLIGADAKLHVYSMQWTQDEQAWGIYRDGALVKPLEGIPDAFAVEIDRKGVEHVFFSIEDAGQHRVYKNEQSSQGMILRYSGDLGQLTPYLDTQGEVHLMTTYRGSGGQHSIYRDSTQDFSDQIIKPEGVMRDAAGGRILYYRNQNKNSRDEVWAGTERMAFGLQDYETLALLGVSRSTVPKAEESKPVRPKTGTEILRSAQDDRAGPMSAVMTGKLLTTAQGVWNWFLKNKFFPEKSGLITYARKASVGFSASWDKNFSNTVGVYGRVRQSPKSRAWVETSFQMEINDTERTGKVILSHRYGFVKADLSGYEGMSIEDEDAPILTFYFKGMTLEPGELEKMDEPNELISDPEQAALLFEGEFEGIGRYRIVVANENEIREKLKLPLVPAVPAVSAGDPPLLISPRKARGEKTNVKPATGSKPAKPSPASKPTPTGKPDPASPSTFDLRPSTSKVPAQLVTGPSADLMAFFEVDVGGDDASKKIKAVFKKIPDTWAMTETNWAEVKLKDGRLIARQYRDKENGFYLRSLGSFDTRKVDFIGTREPDEVGFHYDKLAYGMDRVMPYFVFENTHFLMGPPENLKSAVVVLGEKNKLEYRIHFEKITPEMLEGLEIFARSVLLQNQTPHFKNGAFYIPAPDNTIFMISAEKPFEPKLAAVEPQGPIQPSSFLTDIQGQFPRKGWRKTRGGDYELNGRDEQTEAGIFFDAAGGKVIISIPDIRLEINKRGPGGFESTGGGTLRWIVPPKDLRGISFERTGKAQNLVVNLYLNPALYPQYRIAALPGGRSERWHEDYNEYLMDEKTQVLDGEIRLFAENGDQIRLIFGVPTEKIATAPQFRLPRDENNPLETVMNAYGFLSELADPNLDPKRMKQLLDEDFVTRLWNEGTSFSNTTMMPDGAQINLVLRMAENFLNSADKQKLPLPLGIAELLSVFSSEGLMFLKAMKKSGLINRLEPAIQAARENARTAADSGANNPPGNSSEFVAALDGGIITARLLISRLIAFEEQTGVVLTQDQIREIVNLLRPGARVQLNPWPANVSEMDALIQRIETAVAGLRSEVRREKRVGSWTLEVGSKKGKGEREKVEGRRSKVEGEGENKGRFMFASGFVGAGSKPARTTQEALRSSLLSLSAIKRRMDSSSGERDSVQARSDSASSLSLRGSDPSEAEAISERALSELDFAMQQKFLSAEILDAREPFVAAIVKAMRTPPPSLPRKAGEEQERAGLIKAMQEQGAAVENWNGEIEVVRNPVRHPNDNMLVHLEVEDILYQVEGENRWKVEGRRSKESGKVASSASALSLSHRLPSTFHLPPSTLSFSEFSFRINGQNVLALTRKTDSGTRILIRESLWRSLARAFSAAQITQDAKKAEKAVQAATAVVVAIHELPLQPSNLQLPTSNFRSSLRGSEPTEAEAISRTMTKETEPITAEEASHSFASLPLSATSPFSDLRLSLRGGEQAEAEAISRTATALHESLHYANGPMIRFPLPTLKESKLILVTTAVIEKNYGIARTMEYLTGLGYKVVIHEDAKLQNPAVRTKFYQTYGLAGLVEAKAMTFAQGSGAQLQAQLVSTAGRQLKAGDVVAVSFDGEFQKGDRLLFTQLVLDADVLGITPNHRADFPVLWLGARLLNSAVEVDQKLIQAKVISRVDQGIWALHQTPAGGEFSAALTREIENYFAAAESIRSAA